MAGDSSEITWNVDMEVNLFHAMRGHKPAGVNRHFQMIAIHDRLSLAYKKITSDDVWNHLSTLYDLQALNESEIIPFPNKNGDFEIPDGDKLDLCDKSFPRTPYINTPPVEPVKTEVLSKSTTKSGKQESKSTQQTLKNESKSESKSSSSKSDSRSSTPANRGEQKTGQSSAAKSMAQQNTASSTPEPSPKRTKRTRNVPSATASPAIPTEPPAKRRR